MRATLRRIAGHPDGLLFAPDEVAIAWQAASLLLSYPDDGVREHLPLVTRAAAALPPDVGDPLATVAAYLTDTPPGEAQAAYVETFDTRRRCNLFLTYFAYGDTRKRGMALLRFKQTYLRSGFVLDEAELPDHLCVVLEFAATVHLERGARLLLDHRAGLELLRLSLRDTRSPWFPAVDAVTRTLPPIHGDEMDAVRRLAAEGPPEEEVGLEPYGMPGFGPGPVAPDAGLPGSGGPEWLGAPTMDGRPAGARVHTDHVPPAGEA